MLDPYRHRLLVVIWAVVETSLFSGIMHGWASLVYIVKQEGIYSYLCPESTGSNTSNVTLDTLYTNITAGSATISSLPDAVRTSGDLLNVSLRDKMADIILSVNSSRREYTMADILQTGSSECKAQDDRIALGQTIAGSLSFVGMLAVGQLHRTVGTKKLRIILWFAFVAACLSVALVSNDAPWLIFLAYWLAGVAGLGVLTTNIQVSFLYSAASSTVVSLICGGYDFSGSVMLFVKFAYEAGVSLMVSHLVLAGCSAMTAISAICWLPWKIFTKQEVREVKQGVQDDISSEVTQKLDNGNLETKKGDNSIHKSDPFPPSSLGMCLKSPLFLLHIMWYIILQVRFINIVAFLNPFLVHITNNDTQLVSHYTNVFLYTNMFGYVTSCLAGLVYDWQKARYRADSSPRRRCLLPAVLPFSIASLIAVLASILVLIPNIRVLYAVFILTTAFRSFLYSMAASFLSQVFPGEQFSALYTIMVISGGLVASVQYALYRWAYAYDGAFTHMCITLTVLVLLSFLHPAYIMYTCRGDAHTIHRPAQLKLMPHTVSESDTGLDSHQGSQV